MGPDAVTSMDPEIGHHHGDAQRPGSQAGEDAETYEEGADELHPTGYVHQGAQWMGGGKSPEKEGLLGPVQGHQEGEDHPEYQV